MPQKFCATCTKALTSSEMSLDQIQCGTCYQRWLKTSLPAAEPLIREIMKRLHDENGKDR